MGTAAVFAVRASLTPPKYFATIIGMTSDGFPNNLSYIANAFKDKAAELRLKTKVKRRQWKAIKTVMEAVVADHSDWLFTDQNSNARWVSHSAIYDSNRDTISMFSDHFGTHVATTNLNHLLK
jgi:hypothetical protein